MSLVLCTVFLLYYCSTSPKEQDTDGWLNNRIVNNTRLLDFVLFTRPHRIHSKELSYFFLTFILCTNSTLMKTLQHLHTPHLMTSPCNKDCTPQKVCRFLRTSLPTLTTATAGSVWWWAPMSFITSSLALKIIKFSFLLRVPLLTDSRWGSLPLTEQTMRSGGMSLLTHMGANLNCLWSGLAFMF